MNTTDLFSREQSAPPVGEFDFLPLEKVRFGPGTVGTLAEEIKRLGASRGLIVTGSTLATKTALIDRVVGHLDGLSVAVFSATQQHVPRGSVIAATEAARELGAEIIVSVGGGSPTDTAKLVAFCLAAGVTSAAELDDYHFREQDGQLVIPPGPEQSIPTIAVPTTLSAGEFTLWAGSTDESSGVKNSFGAPHLTPRVVILDPEMTVETPAGLWGTTGLKAIDHAVETVCSVGSQPFGDALALQAIRILTEALPRSVANASDLAARGLCQVGSWLSITSLPSVPAGLSHALGHQLGSAYDIPHGVTSGIFLPAVLDFNRPVNAARQALVANAMGLDGPDLSAEQAGAAVSQRLRELADEFGVERRLSAWGVKEDDLQAIAADVAEDFMSLTNPRPASQDDIGSLLRELL